MKPIKKTFTLGDHQVTLETGEIARQAHGAVICTIDDTVVLATVVAAKEPKAGQDWFPLTVDYAERTYAAGKIPGGFFKREGRPSEKETLTSRLIDRPIRPLFPDGFFNEVQVVAQVLSLNPEVDSDIPAMLAVSAALTISGIPFNGPIGACRVGYVDGQYVINPTATQIKESQAQPGGRRHRAGRADGGVRGAGAARGRDARRRGVRPRADAGGDPGDQRAGRSRRQARLGLDGRRPRTRR